MEENKYKSVFDRNNYDFINSNNIEINKNKTKVKRRINTLAPARFPARGLLYFIPLRVRTRAAAGIEGGTPFFLFVNSELGAFHFWIYPYCTRSHP